MPASDFSFILPNLTFVNKKLNHNATNIKLKIKYLVYSFQGSQNGQLDFSNSLAEDIMTVCI